MISLVSAHKVCCRYSNPADQFQIVRMVHRPGCFFERKVLLREAIHFEADPQDILENHAGAILSDRIPCDHLQDAPRRARRFSRQ